MCAAMHDFVAQEHTADSITHFIYRPCSSGRELAELFLALPSKDEYPEYYEVIKSPMSLQLVQVCALSDKLASRML
jgi:hypothetical protein